MSKQDKQQKIDVLLKQYIHVGTKINTQRCQRLEQANHYIKKQINTINISLNQLSKCQTNYNKQLDEIIGSLDVVNQIQSNVNKTVQNLNKIDQVLIRLENKLEILKKNKSK